MAETFASTVTNQTDTVSVPSEEQGGEDHIFSFFFRLADYGSATPTPDIDKKVAFFEGPVVSCAGFNGLKIKGESSNATGTVAVAVKTKDVQGVWSISERRTPGNLGIQGDTIETNYYHLAELFIDLAGSSEYRILQMGAPSDSAVTSFFGVKI